MTNTALLERFNEAMRAANDVWGIQPVQEVRMPVLKNQRTVVTEEIHALWTDGGLRPNAKNLAFLMQRVSNDELEQWKQSLKTLPVRASLLVTSDELYLLQSDFSSLGESEPELLNLDTWRETLVSPKSHLFKPQELAKLKSGQLSLADLEETFSEGSFNSLLREQQKELDQAFLRGIQEALQFVESSQGSGSSRAEAKGDVIRFSIAYLAARILEDKNFFDARIEDPIELLDRIGKIRNGFFKRAKASADRVPLEARQALTRHMGYQVSFVLADHRDVGRLYEKAIKSLKDQYEELDSENWGDLKQHYTPVALAERMLEALPLERLRPSERVIFDPAAGSGSLLLAATSRLATMTDIPQEELDSYLRSHVIGNDQDEYASWIAQLRYFLASESLGSAGEPDQISEVLPFPNNFTCFDYNDLDDQILPVKPRVIVANPPFEQKGKVQEAANFVKRALSWMEETSQFAFILPQSFLTGTKRQVGAIRDLINQQCEILEIWQFPEGCIGTNARQSTCVLIGIKGKKQGNISTISRGIFSGAQLDETRENGFLGYSWIGHLKPNSKDWESVISQNIGSDVSTVFLGNLFYVFNGIKLDGVHKPIGEPVNGIKCKRYWRTEWKGKNSLWADPNNVSPNEKWIRYGREFLARPRLANEKLFDLPKILISRRANRNSSEPLVVRFDTIGFCPNLDVFCVLPIGHARKQNDGFSADETPEGWNNLTYEEQRFWLLGILTSNLLCDLSLSMRDSRGITVDAILRLPLPRQIDNRIIEVSKQIVQGEQNYEALDDQNDLRRRLNDLVENSYGNPNWRSIERTGITSELEAWKTEQKVQRTKTTICQVLDISQSSNQVYMYISRLMEDDNAEGEWIPLPQELPGWALDGTPFEAELSHDIETFEQLRERPWALRRFRHEPRAYLTGNELDEFLRIPEMEIPS
ncbi:MAG: N-6 DNA methylase [Lyngbya sp. HA4199-MV5]|nr:N-6 DNA methylase [Lyngbya sp. HA4199-MV5]